MDLICHISYEDLYSPTSLTFRKALTKAHPRGRKDYSSPISLILSGAILIVVRT